ncbi:hypothetical protein Htur_1149 [Haloterrigena turkmenica DSM 5511]|uniref:Uncharacterized protein n=1 Tax=Haloterrigena turkmenica (strain ATCC 51198 / DSM 5511 / JCM 9101 / NCIMB 13204 / VKM B-1734 / 4k) TaxID=543526 RepID=D2RZB7_HALTV|nr:hypothetical protein [Haloterrigena turkmenica]ADB60041.1 hypothetical protein Htur_1149 [Haloterrigena turkmenica DSM 5511]
MDAIDDLGDAIEASRDFLTPIRPGTWVKLAFVVVFVSSLGFGFSTSVPGSDVLTVSGDPTGEVWQLENFDGTVPTDELAAFVLALAGLALLAWLCYAFVAAIMEFVFLESLRSNEVRVRRYFAANVGNGARLFCFRLGLLLVVSALGAAPAYVISAGGGSLGDLSPGVFGLYSIYGFTLYVGYSAVRRFTDAFVAPIMLLEDRGVVGAWGRFRKSLAANWSEYAVYLVLFWFLYLAVLIGAWIVVGIGLLLLMIPIGIVWFVLILLGPIGLLLFVVVGPLSLAAVLLFMGLVWAPITTFFRYYALLLLGDTDDDLDLIPDQRAAIRGDGGAATGRDDDWAGVSRGPSHRADRSSSDGRALDDGDPWAETDPWADADGADSWDDSDDPGSGPGYDPWSEASDPDRESDPWTETNDSSSTDPWDEPIESDEEAGTDNGDPWDEPIESDETSPRDEPTETDETDSEDETNGSDDTVDDEDDRPW